MCVKKVGFEQSPGVIAVLAVEDLIARGGARAAGSAAKAASGMSHSTPHHTPASQPQGPAILKKEGGGGGGGPQATYQKPSNKPAFDEDLVGKPSIRENFGEIKALDLPEKVALNGHMKKKVPDNGTKNVTSYADPLQLGYTPQGRNVPGRAHMSLELKNPERMMRGTQQNAGKVPLEVASKLSGREFRDFNHFRCEFWKAMANSKYAKEFGKKNLIRMQKGAAPSVLSGQKIGKRTSYELHHMTPIQKGGSVYDVSNILIVTPKKHSQILLPKYHYGK